MPRLVVVRHAQSEWNAEGRWQGRADPPLSPAGEEQARLAGAALADAIAAGDAPGPITAVWSSDLRRARDTAALLGSAAGWRGPLREVRDLREHDVGEWSGLTHGEIEQRWPGLIEEWGAGRLAATPGGEPRTAFDRRVRQGLLTVVAAAHTGDPGPGLHVVVTHGGVLRAVARWLGHPERALSQLEGFLLCAAAPSSEPLLEGPVALLQGWGEPAPRPPR
ncbi:histidine phosphatase family protein [Acidiferrimicrobium sp. IK]|uniref:histidine phosphatase family protein n=1 Tax=Acidiferrimicrobium sp. IK TaxID=2871700 RepID=UPI0021CB15B3|nr:histidine phosphatase family protein [Acidiferrimicrobium sp. IK]MCU4183139.1 histidine phosphatase family protein [Acidiferrimicrobium sp. IK]